jgi:hypothetical protein
MFNFQCLQKEKTFPKEMMDIQEIIEETPAHSCCFYCVLPK